jgi:hypothetical protein
MKNFNEKKDQPLADLLAQQQEYQADIDAQFAAIEKSQDPAEQILKLQDAISTIDYVDTEMVEERWKVAAGRGNKKLLKMYGATSAAGMAAIIAPAAVLAPPLVGIAAVASLAAPFLSAAVPLFAERSVKTKKQDELLAQVPALGAFVEYLKEKKAEAEKQLDDTARNCNAEKVSRSPLFAEACLRNKTLRARFPKKGAQPGL